MTSNLHSAADAASACAQAIREAHNSATREQPVIAPGLGDLYVRASELRDRLRLLAGLADEQADNETPHHD